MKKFINSLLYGSSKTKSYLWSMLILAIAAAGFLSAALFLQSYGMGAIGLLSAGLDVVIYQSVSFRDIIGEEQEHVKKSKEKNRKQKSIDLGTENEEERKDAETLINELGMKEFSKEKEKEKSFKKYNNDAVKRIMIKYKVKKEHKKIIIDSSQVFKISQCPAFVWKVKKEAKFLLLEEEPRIIRVPMERITKVGYKKMEEAKPEMDYEAFKTPSFVEKIFSEFLPVYKEGIYRGKMGFYKNLYTVAPDIHVTAASARNLMDVLELDFDVNDEITNGGIYSEYYKSAYRTNILWKDSVISTNEYKERIKTLLSTMASEKLSKQVYEKLLIQLVEHKLITKEYAKYYQDLRK